MLEVGCRRSGRADDGRIERTTRCCECAQQCEAGSDLEPRRSNVPVWDAVADPVQYEPEESGAESRAGERAACRARGHVHRHDHSGSVCRTIRMPPEARRPGTSPSRQSPPPPRHKTQARSGERQAPCLESLDRSSTSRKGLGMIRRVLGQRRRAFAGVVAVTLVALAVGVAQALAGGTGTATSPLEKNKETCGAEAGLSVIGSVTFTRIDKTTLRTAVRLQKFSPSTKHNVYVIGGPGCGASTFVGTVKTDSDGQETPRSRPAPTDTRVSGCSSLRRSRHRRRVGDRQGRRITARTGSRRVRREHRSRITRPGRIEPLSHGATNAAQALRSASGCPLLARRVR